MSIADRVARLNLQHIDRNDARDISPKQPAANAEAPPPAVARAAPPPLPSRAISVPPPVVPAKPLLPPRQSSNNVVAKPQASNNLSTLRNISSVTQQTIGYDNTRRLAVGAVNAATTRDGTAARYLDRAAGHVDGGKTTLNSIRNANSAAERTLGKDNAQRFRASMVGAALDANRGSTLTAPVSPLPPSRSMSSPVGPAAKPPLPLKPTLPPKPTATAQPSYHNTSLPSLSPAAPARRSALEMGFNNKPVAPSQSSNSSSSISSLKGAIKKLSSSTSSPSNASSYNMPPQLNLATKPKFTQQNHVHRQPLGFGSQIMPANAAPTQMRYALPPIENGQNCLLCRDFSEEDAHASRFPRHTVSSLERLAYDLTSPFHSLTSKARAIFTWFHFNIRYNTEAFFNGSIQPSTPASTLASGLAVCEGYAGLFSNLALHAGLECVTIVGHGKGFGHQPLQPGQAIPAYKSSHAWNACRIDDADGGWKLIDPCWGAGHISNGQQYVAKLNSAQFTQSNSEFGLRHFPEDQSQFYLIAPESGGPPRPPSWEEYFSNPAGTGHGDISLGQDAESNGFGLSSCFFPRKGDIDFRDAAAYGPKMRLEIHKVCRHWDKIWLQGKGKRQRPFMIQYGSGSDAKWLPFVPISGGSSWFALVDIDDVRRRCKPGDDIWCFAVGNFDGKDAAGISATQAAEGIGRVSMSWLGVARWKIGSS